MDENTLKCEIEKLIDATTVWQVAQAIADVCFDKAEHIRTNWQDEPLAKRWEQCSAQLSRAAQAARDRGV